MSAVFILVRQTGCYDDYRETPIAAFRSQKKADAGREKAQQEWVAAVEAHPATPYPPDDCSDAEWEAWEATMEAIWQAFKADLTVDPGAAPDGAWGTPDSDTEYSVWRVPFAGTQP